MIFLILGAVLIIAAVSYWIGGGWFSRGAVAGGLIIAGGVYVIMGAPGVEDKPLKGRLLNLQEIARSEPEKLDARQHLALLQKIAKERPTDPQPHKFIGDTLVSMRRMDEAVRAYQSALRRDPEFSPALQALADTIVMQDRGEISVTAANLYAAAFQSDPMDVKSAFMAGMNKWQTGDKQAAREWWIGIENAYPEGSMHRARMRELREGLETAELSEQAE